MSLPPVICESCGARYRHPGRAGRTHCKKCGAEITIPAPEAAAPPPAAEPPVVVPAEPPTVAPAEPPVVAPASAAEPTAEAPAAEPARSPRRESRPRSAVGRRRESRGSTRKKAEAEGEAEASGKGGRRSSRAGRRRSRPSRKPKTRRERERAGEDVPHHESRHYHRKEPNKAMLWASVGGCVVALGVIVYLVTASDPKPPPANEKAEKAQAQAAKPKPEPEKPKIDDPTADLMGGGDTPEAGEPEVEIGGEPEGPGEELVPSAPTTEPDPPSREVAGAGKWAKRHGELSPFGPPSGLGAEERDEIAEKVSQAADPNSGAMGNRARDWLIKKGKPAIPFLIDRLLKVDVDGDFDAILSGRMLHEALYEITRRGRRSAWASDEGHEGGYWRSRTRKDWYDWWKKSGSSWTGPAEEDDED